MKQHITIDQLNELSDSGKEKLRKWWKPEDFDLVVQGMDSIYTEKHVDHVLTFRELFSIKSLETIKKDNLPLLSIGQMIEFLDEHGAYYLNGIEMVQANELCDFLWLEVKKILEKETK